MAQLLVSPPQPNQSRLGPNNEEAEFVLDKYLNRSCTCPDGENVNHRTGCQSVLPPGLQKLLDDGTALVCLDVTGRTLWTNPQFCDLFDTKFDSLIDNYLNPLQIVAHRMMLRRALEWRHWALTSNSSNVPTSEEFYRSFVFSLVFSRSHSCCVCYRMPEVEYDADQINRSRSFASLPKTPIEAYETESASFFTESVVLNHTRLLNGHELSHSFSHSTSDVITVQHDSRSVSRDTTVVLRNQPHCLTPRAAEDLLSWIPRRLLRYLVPSDFNSQFLTFWTVLPIRIDDIDLGSISAIETILSRHQMHVIDSSADDDGPC